MFLSLCGIGFLPKRIGAGVAVLLTGVLLYALHLLLPVNPLYRFALLGGMALVTFALGAKAIPLAKDGSLYDHHWIVIDELLGVLLAFAPMMIWRPGEFMFVTAAALTMLFGFFDHWKPLGIRSIDAMEDWPIAVLLDDCVAGVYAALVYFVVERLL